MSRDPGRPDAKRLADMLQSLRRVREITDRRKEAFLADPTAQEAVAFHLMALGEAAERLSKRTKNRNPAVPWRLLSDLRWRFAHAYFETDLSATWVLVHRDLVGIERQLKNVRPAQDPD